MARRQHQLPLALLVLFALAAAAVIPSLVSQQRLTAPPASYLVGGTWRLGPGVSRRDNPQQFGLHFGMDVTFYPDGTCELRQGLSRSLFFAPDRENRGPGNLEERLVRLREIDPPPAPVEHGRWRIDASGIVIEQGSRRLLALTWRGADELWELGPAARGPWLRHHRPPNERTATEEDATVAVPRLAAPIRSPADLFVQADVRPGSSVARAR